MSSSYRRVLGIPGALAFSVSGLVGRLPISMITIGIVVLVVDRTGSYTQAGTVSATYMVATALGAVPLARFVDRHGQGRVLGPAVTVSVAALAGLVVSVDRGQQGWPYVFAVLSGATMPNVGAAVRARWSHVVPDRQLLDTAFAVEAVNDEIIFMLGPTLVTLLAAASYPLAGLASAGAAAAVGTWALASQRRTEPPRASAEDRRGARDPMPWLLLAPLVGGGVMQGMLFGGTEVAVVAFADERDTPALAGVLLALWALGSLLSGVVSGLLTFRRGPVSRYRIGVVALAALLLPLPFVGSSPMLGALLFLGGFAISPTMIAAVSWVETLVPASRLNEGMTLFTTGLVAGVAPGAALVGAVVDRAGASASFWVPVAAGAGAAVLASLGREQASS